MFSGSNIKGYMLEEINHLICHYASYTGGVNVEISLNPKQKNSEYLKDVMKLVGETIDQGDLNETAVQDFYTKHTEKLTGQTAEVEQEIQEDPTLDEKYYIINYDEEPFIPQQHYFNAFYSVDQIMYDREEAEEALAEHQQQRLEMEQQGQYEDQGYDEQDDQMLHGQYE